MTEEPKWWLAWPLSDADRDRMTDVQREERKLQRVQRQLALAEKKLTDVRRKRLTKIMDTWVRGVAFRELTHDDDHDGYLSLKVWLRGQFKEALISSFTGYQGVGPQIENIVKEEVNKFLSQYKRLGESSKFSDYIRGIVMDEVRKQIAESVTIEAVIKGTVHRPAKGQRALNLTGEEE